MNLRIVVFVALMLAMLAFCAIVIFLGYEDAASHAIGHFAPIGDPTNIKTK